MIIKVFMRATLVLSFFGGPACAETGRQSEVDSIPIRGEDHQIMVPVKMMGHTYQFVLDTGSTNCVVDRSLADVLKPSRANAGSGKSIRFEAPNAFVGSASLKIVDNVLCIDLASQFGQSVSGILGMSFLENYALQLDHDRGVGRIVVSDTLSREALGTPFWLRYEAKRPHLQVTINDELTTSFLLDSGATCTGAVAEQVFTSLSNTKLVVAGFSDYVSVNGVGTLPLVRVARVSIGAFQHNDQVFSVYKKSLLGTNYLSRYLVTFDFPNDVVYFKPGIGFNDYDYTDLDGIMLELTDEGVIFACYVLPFGRAGKSGVRKGDIIVTVNRRQGLTIAEVRSTLLHSQKNVLLGIQRGEQLLQIEMRRAQAE